MDTLNKARKMFDRQMNGTSRDVSGWLTDIGPEHEDISDKITGESGRLFRIPGTNRAELFVRAREPGTFMLVLASVLLLALAVAQGYVSYRAQFVFIHSAGKGQTPATLEALGLDAAAAIFAFLGLAKARRGKSGACRARSQRPVRVRQWLHECPGRGPGQPPECRGLCLAACSVCGYL